MIYPDRSITCCEIMLQFLFVIISATLSSDIIKIAVYLESSRKINFNLISDFPSK